MAPARHRIVTNPWIAILAMFVISRAFILVSAHAGARSMSADKRAEWAWIPDKSDLFRGPCPPPLLAPLVRWDANFHLMLAQYGYPVSPVNDRPVYYVAFFPLYPLTVRAVEHAVGNLFWAAFLVSNAFTLLASLVLYRVGAAGGGGGSGLRACALLLFAPGSHFLAMPYPEGMFVAFLSLAALALKRQRLWLAASSGALASATRSAGIVVALLCFYIAWRRRSFRAILAGALSLAGVVAFAVFCQRQYGDALAFVHVQSRYVNARPISLLGPIKAFLAFNVDPDYYLVTFASVGICIWMVVKRAAALDALGAWFLWLFPLSTGTLKAMIRYQSANVPLLLGAANVPLEGRTFRYVILLSAILLLLEAFLFGRGIGHY